MSIESAHWYRVDREHEDAGAAVDARELAVAAKVDAFFEHGGIWVGSEYFLKDDAMQMVYDSQAYSEWYRRKEQASGVELERIGKEYDELIAGLLNAAVTTLANRAVDQDIEDAA